MGSLWNFDFSDEFVRKFPIFVETGYGTGGGVEHASKFGFARIYSIEMYPPAANHGREKFAHLANVEIIEAESVEGIRNVLRRHPEWGIFFWLDAHFPGADYYGEPWDAHLPIVRLPLERELKVIAEGCSRYAILADDFGYYADLPNQQRWVPPWRAVRSLDFLTRFTKTHSVHLMLNDKGYVLMVPLGAPMPRMMTTEK